MDAVNGIFGLWPIAGELIYSPPTALGATSTPWSLKGGGVPMDAENSVSSRVSREPWIPPPPLLTSTIMVERLHSKIKSILGIGKVCAAPYMGARRFPADLNSHLPDSRLPFRAHEKSIEPSTQQTCKKAPLPAQYSVSGNSRLISWAWVGWGRLCLKSTTYIVLSRQKHHQGCKLTETLRFQRRKATSSHVRSNTLSQLSPKSHQPPLHI